MTSAARARLWQIQVTEHRQRRPDEHERQEDGSATIPLPRDRVLSHLTASVPHLAPIDRARHQRAGSKGHGLPRTGRLRCSRAPPLPHTPIDSESTNARANVRSERRRTRRLEGTTAKVFIAALSLSMRGPDLAPAVSGSRAARWPASTGCMTDIVHADRRRLPHDDESDRGLPDRSVRDRRRRHHRQVP